MSYMTVRAEERRSRIAAIERRNHEAGLHTRKVDTCALCQKDESSPWNDAPCSRCGGYLGEHSESCDAVHHPLCIGRHSDTGQCVGVVTE